MIRWKRLYQGVLATGTPATPVYTAPANTYAAIHAATCFNPGAAAVTVDVWIAPAGGTATDGTKVATKSIPNGTSAPLTDLVNMKLEPGMLLFAAGDGVTLTIAGAENVPE